MAKNIHEIYTAEDCKQYLANIYPKCLSKRLYQYTSCNALINMIKYGKFRLSRIDLLNDKAEMMFGDEKILYSSYVLSFSEESKEDIHMWNMYGNKSEIKIRISFPSTYIEKLDKSTITDKRCGIEHSTVSFIDVEGNDKIFAGDVAYAAKRSNNTISLKHNRKQFRNLKVDEDVEKYLTCLIKDDIWQNEKEFRVVIYSPFRKNVKIDDYELIGIKYVYIDIPEEIKNNIEVTFNPWISDEMFEVMQKELYEISQKNGFTLKIKKSNFTGRIR